MEIPVDHSGSGSPILNILGEKVALGPLRQELLPLYQRWINDFEVIRTLGPRVRPTTLQGEEGWLTRASLTSDRDIEFTIYERASLRPIGNTGLHNIDHLHSTAGFGILVGEKDCWGKGYGTEATTLMLDFGFTALSLHNIMLTVVSFNERGIRAYLRAGFKIIGRRREARRLGGRAYDDIYMDCLATEFQSPALYRLLPES